MIKKIKWNNYKAIGDLELDFTKEDGTLYNTIILAGENGCGKTTILDTLSKFLNRDTIEPFEYIEYMVNERVYDIIPAENGKQFGFHRRIDIETGNQEVIRTNHNNYPEQIEKDDKDLRHYGYVYSKARSGFKTKQVKSLTTQQLDIDKYESDEEDDYTRIKQLLIDIDGQDACKIKEICEKNEGIDEEEYKGLITQLNMYRFKNAFNNFFENIKFKTIDNSTLEEKKIIFTKYDKEISIDQLSTGEKQIVFRGAHMLKNTNSIKGGLALIDEPELSMHPIWQKRILEYYRSLFIYDNNQQVQIIVATHSEYVVQSALADKENVLVIVLSNHDGIIEAHKVVAPSVLPTITSAETNYLAFGIASIDYHIELYGYLQSKTENTRVKDCDEYISRHPLFDENIYAKEDRHNNTNYVTLPTYIRNAIDHPDSGRVYSGEELEKSINLLRELCKQ